MIDPGSPDFPAAKDDDDDDVAWALSTAAVQWKRGSQADAVVWLRRAIESAVAVGATWRAAELTRQTDAVESFVVSGPAAAPAPSLIDVDDFEGGDLIDTEALSLPPDADLDELSQPALSADSTDEITDISAEEDLAESDDSSVEELAEEAIADDDISEDEIADDELDDGLTPRASVAEIEAEAGAQRFPSEAPTADMSAPELAELEGAYTPEDLEPATVSEPEPHFSEPDEDPLPTPVRLSVADVMLEERGASDARRDAPEPEPAAEAEPEPAAEAEPEPVAEPLVAGVSLSDIRGFEDFPPETQLALAKAARVERLSIDEEVGGFGLALVLRGSVNVMPAIADIACGSAGERELVYGRGSLQDGVALRLVATIPDTQVAVWDFESIEPPLADCPWVREELQAVADRYQALAGVAMGPMGDRLDDSLRGLVLSRCKLVRLLPGEILLEKGKPVGGLFIVGAGRIELGNGELGVAVEAELGPGDFLFAPQVLAQATAPMAARAGAAGALLMAADRHAAHELMVSVPPLLELLAG